LAASQTQSQSAAFAWFIKNTATNAAAKSNRQNRAGIFESSFMMLNQKKIREA
jgi:hypothetical protein